MKYIFCMIAMLFTVVGNAAETDAVPGRRSPGRRSFGGGRMYDEIKKKYPAEFAEIEKLRASDPEGARTKMRELMRKAAPEMGFGRGFRRGGDRQAPGTLSAEMLQKIKEKYPEEFAEYEKLKSSEPEKAAEKLKELTEKFFAGNPPEPEKNLRDRNRRAVSSVMRQLKEKYPERFAEIEKMREIDPDGARAELRKMFKEANLRMPDGMNVLNYEYQDPKLNNPNMRNNMPGSGGRMMPPWWMRGGR